MQQSKIQPDAVTFATLIKGQLKAQLFSDALDTAIQMVQVRPKAGPRSDPYTEVYHKFRQTLNYKQNLVGQQRPDDVQFVMWALQ